MKTITEQIVERLEELAVEWSNHTPQCEALFMAAKEASTFQDKEREQLMHYSIAYNEVQQLLYTPEEFFELWHKFDDKPFNTNREMNQCKCTAPTIATKVSENGIYSYCTKCAEEVETFNTKEK